MEEGARGGAIDVSAKVTEKEGDKSATSPGKTTLKHYFFRGFGTIMERDDALKDMKELWHREVPDFR
eukprot:12842685-Ditylum_brightwellii.AAC.1